MFSSVPFGRVFSTASCSRPPACTAESASKLEPDSADGSGATGQHTEATAVHSLAKTAGSFQAGQPHQRSGSPLFGAPSRRVCRHHRCPIGHGPFIAKQSPSSNWQFRLRITLFCILALKLLPLQSQHLDPRISLVVDDIGELQLIT